MFLIPPQHTPQTQAHKTSKLTNCPDYSLLQLLFLVSFNYLGANVVATIIGASQLIVNAQTELPQQSIKHLQHCRTCT